MRNYLQQNWKLLFLIYLGAISALGSFAQQKTITGKVVDAAANETIIGASVKIKGTNVGTQTDVNGNFSLSAQPNATLEISYLGYQSVEVKADFTKPMTINLQSDDKQLSEVVVVGYGTQKKATLTGAVETISSKSFEDRAVTNVGLALQGQTPGLVVTRSSPRPGNEGLGFKIRGASSVNGSNPLIIIDGVPALNFYSFQNMNSDDIESISVLKDGAAAIYGSRAANGVILVTTKRGKGKVKVDYNGNFRFNTNGLVAYSPSMQEYATMWIEANKEETVPNWWIWGEDNVKKMAAGVEGKYDIANFSGVDFYIYNANRIDEMFSTRYSYQHNLSIAGGADKSSYRMSFGYADNQGNLATAYDGQKQMNARVNYDYRLTDKLKLESDISIIQANTGQPSRGLGNILYSFDMPFYPAKNPLGQWMAPFNAVDNGANRNAAATTSDAGRYNKKSFTGRADLKATYDFGKGFSAEGLASIQNERYDHELWVVPVQLYDWYGNLAAKAANTDGANNTFTANAFSSYYQYYQALLKYQKTFGSKHNLQAMGGITAEKTGTRSLTGSRLGFEDRGVYDLGLAALDAPTNASGKSVNGRYSYISRLNYNYDEKYLLELIGRRDGNSRFAEGYKFKNFGSAQIGWIFTEEKFLSPLAGILDFGKIRVSYAATGNEADGLGAFDYLSLINVGSAVLGQTPAKQTATGLTNNGLISYTRTWEKVVQKNLGIDLNFLKNRLNASFDIYEKDNIGMLIDVTYPALLGGTAPKTNSGRFNTKGWEAVLGWKDVKGDFSYNVAVNMGDANTMVSGVEGKDSYGAGRNGIVNGYPFQPWFVYKTDGYFKDQAEVDAYYAAYGASDNLLTLLSTDPQKTLRPGDTKKVDVAGTGNITAAGNEKSSLVYAGDGTPHYTYGINLGGSWKGLDLNVFFQGHLKQRIMREGYMAYPFRAIYTNQNPMFLGRTWTVDNLGAEFPRLTSYTDRAAWNYVNNDFMLQNSRYIRLKSFVLGYTLPKKLTQRVKMDKVRVYFSGNDLWEASAIKDGFDPEAGQNATDGDNAGYPFARTWSFGLNIGL
ncbi:SusC/RagA family TonB-linked outer membrane protein [Pelobium manganitolerans]|uniref:SusC/RagA family TonB-linked outer membrane protein n=1 Tax=Pelobium manganitolerans TaxID=1842495 RepID=UPI003FA34D40